MSDTDARDDPTVTPVEPGLSSPGLEAVALPDDPLRDAEELLGLIGSEAKVNDTALGPHLPPIDVDEMLGEVPAATRARQPAHLPADLLESPPISTDPAVEIRGHLDAVSDTRIIGWALHLMDGQERPLPEVRVVVAEDGTVVAAGVAGEYRRDLRDADLGRGWSGFDLATSIPPSARSMLLRLEVSTPAGWVPVATHELQPKREGSLQPTSLLDAFAQAGVSGGVVGRSGLQLGSNVWLQAASGVAESIQVSLQLVRLSSGTSGGDRVPALRVESQRPATGRIDLRFKIADHAALVEGGRLQLRLRGRSGQRQSLRVHLFDHRGRVTLDDFVIPSHTWSTVSVRVPTHRCGDDTADALGNALWLELLLDAATPVDVLAPEIVERAPDDSFECPNVQEQQHYLELQSRAAGGSPFSVIIPFYGKAAFTAAAVRSVFACSWGTPEVVLVDDGSPNRSSVDRILAELGGRVRLIRSDVNLGYTASVNMGMHAASHDLAIILNNDTRVTPGWDAPLLEALAHDQVFAAGPLSNAASYQSVPQQRENGRWAVNVLPATIEPAALAAALRERFKDYTVPLGVLNGFCYAVRREQFLALGGLDEDAFPMGYGEEVDLMLRARAEGFHHVVVPASFVYHYKSVTFQGDRAALNQQGGAVVRARWETQLAEAIREMDSHPELDEVRAEVLDIFAALESDARG